jgi:surfeit locus 1 family protein
MIKINNKYILLFKFKDYTIKCSLIALIVIAIACFIMLKLGFWQIDRGLYKQKNHYQFAKNAPAIDIKKIINKNKITNFTKIKALASCDKKKLLLVDLKRNQGKIGFHALMPCKIKSSEMILLVNLGWVKKANIGDLQLKRPTKLVGKIKTLQHNPFVLQNKAVDLGSFPVVMQGTEKTYIEKILKQKILPFTLLLDDKEKIGFVKNWQINIISAKRHFFYAAQWFLFAIIAAMMFLYVNTSKNLKA